MGIINGKDADLGVASSALPYVGTALYGLLQPMTFTTIAKSVYQGLVTELQTNVSVRCSRQPFSPQRLALKPEGQRAWRWELLFADPSLVLSPDDRVIFGGRPYRVMAKYDYKEYGYVQYEIAEDFTS